jgi:hypothetical protein
MFSSALLALECADSKKSMTISFGAGGSAPSVAAGAYNTNVQNKQQAIESTAHHDIALAQEQASFVMYEIYAKRLLCCARR